jgi:hypothetical protein
MVLPRHAGWSAETRTRELRTGAKTARRCLLDKATGTRAAADLRSAPLARRVELRRTRAHLNWSMNSGNTGFRRARASRRAARFVAATLVALCACTAIASQAEALEPDRGGWYHTGDGVMTKNVAIFHVDVFSVGHDMKCLPDHKSRISVVSAGCDKRFRWRALRDVGKGDIREALQSAYASIDYGDQAKVRRAVSAFQTGLNEGALVTISYDAASKSTTFAPPRGGKVVIGGADFMRATWSILFVNPELRKLGDALMDKL